MEYLLHILVLVAIYAMLAVSLDLLAGHSGLLSVSQAAFFGLGAYTSALLAVSMGTPFVAGVVGGMAVAAVVSLVVSLPSLRLHDDYFVIATFGFQMIVFSVFNNWIDLTHGPLGVPGIPPPKILGFTISSKGAFITLAGLFCVIAYMIVGRLTGSAFGRVLHAIREDERLAESFAKNTLWFKVLAFGISAAIAASAGSLYAHYVSFIDPTSFTVTESIVIMSMVIIGGAGSTWGPLVGAAVLVGLPEALRFVGLPSALAGNVRQIIYGAALVTFMMWRPRGLLGRYGFHRGSRA